MLYINPAGSRALVNMCLVKTISTRLSYWWQIILWATRVSWSAVARHLASTKPMLKPKLTWYGSSICGFVFIVLVSKAPDNKNKEINPQKTWKISIIWGLARYANYRDYEVKVHAWLVEAYRAIIHSLFLFNLFSICWHRCLSQCKNLSDILMG